MFEIVTEKGDSLFLGNDFKIEFEFNNPLNDDDVIPPNYTVPGRIPYTAKNDQILNNCSCIAIRNRVGKKYTSYPNTKLKFNGNFFLLGTMVIIDVDRDLASGSFNFTFVVNGFSTDMKGKKLKDLSWPADYHLGDDTDEIIATAKSLTALSYPETNFVFPMVKAPNFYGEANPEFVGYINNYDSENDRYYKQNFGEPNKYCLVPYLYEKFVIDTIFKSWQITGNYYDASRRRLIVNNNFDLSSKVDVYHWRASSTGTMTIPALNSATTVNNITDDFTSPNFDLDDAYDGPSSRGIVMTTGTKTIKGSFRYKINGVHSEVKATVWIRGATGLTAYLYDLEVDNDVWYTVDFTCTYNAFSSYLGQFVTAEVMFLGRDSLLTLWEEADGESGEFEMLYWEGIDVSASNTNLFSKYVHYANHVPDMEVDEWLQEKKKEGMAIYFNPLTRIVRIDYIDTVISNVPVPIDAVVRDKRRLTFAKNEGFTFNFTFPDDELKVADLPDLSIYELGTVDSYALLPPAAVLNMVYLVKQLNAYYITKLSGGYVVWQFLCYNYFDRVIGLGGQDIKTAFSPFLMIRENIGDPIYTLPKILETGSSEMFGLGVNPPQLKQMFHYGFHINSAAQNYPFASSHNYNTNGDQVSPISLTYFGDESFFESDFFKWYSNLDVADRITFMLDINPKFIAGLDMGTTFFYNSQKYVMMLMQGAYEERRISECETEFIKL